MLAQEPNRMNLKDSAHEGSPSALMARRILHDQLSERGLLFPRSGEVSVAGDMTSLVRKSRKPDTVFKICGHVRTRPRGVNFHREFLICRISRKRCCPELMIRNQELVPTACAS